MDIEDIFSKIDARIKSDKKIKNYLLFICSQEIGQEDAIYLLSRLIEEYTMKCLGL